MSAASFDFSSPASQDRPDAGLDRALRRVVLAGLALVLLVPLARARTVAHGWLPLWLVGMPLAAWWSLRGFPVPALAVRMPRRRRAQASRRTRRARHDLQQARQA